uniref:Putative ovule protein n=1 Tax=Solanum chacoense TaxID=4108 RepID=A0A0V0GP20_SOLCH
MANTRLQSEGKPIQLEENKKHKSNKVVLLFCKRTASDALDRRSFNGLLLRCLSHEEAQQALQEVHALLIGA